MSEGCQTKTIIELHELKNKQTTPFRNAYSFLILDIQNDLISKFDGMERAKSELSAWDSEAKELNKVSVIEAFEGDYDFVLNNADMLEEFAKL